MKIDALMVVIACLLIFILCVASFGGRCPDFFGASTKPCSFLEYLRFNFGMTFLMAIFFLWWAVIPALVLPPLLGLIIGYYKS